MQPLKEGSGTVNRFQLCVSLRNTCSILDPLTVNKVIELHVQKCFAMSLDQQRSASLIEALLLHCLIYIFFKLDFQLSDLSCNVLDLFFFLLLLCIRVTKLRCRVVVGVVKALRDSIKVDLGEIVCSKFFARSPTWWCGGSYRGV